MRRLRIAFLAILLALGLSARAVAQTPVIPVPVSQPNFALAPQIAAAASTLAVKTSGGGNLYDAYGTNSSGSTIYLYAFNSATAPSSGSVTAGTAAGNYQDCIAIQAGTSQSLLVAGEPPEPFSAGIYLGASSAACGTFTPTSIAFMKARGQ